MRSYKQVTRLLFEMSLRSKGAILQNMLPTFTESSDCFMFIDIYLYPIPELKTKLYWIDTNSTDQRSIAVRRSQSTRSSYGYRIGRWGHHGAETCRFPFGQSAGPKISPSSPSSLVTVLSSQHQTVNRQTTNSFHRNCRNVRTQS